MALSRFTAQEIVPKTAAALAAGNPPDLAYGDAFDAHAPKWAYDGRLESLAGVLAPIKARFVPNALAAAYLYDNQAKKRAYYAFPVKQQALHIQYWRDMLAEAGFKESDIPRKWKAYWDFWCGPVQEGYRKNTGGRAYAVGHPMGVDSSDSWFSYLTFLDAYNVRLVTDDGKLNVDSKATRQGLIDSLRDYTSTVGRGCTPSSAVGWKDRDNNLGFHGKALILTHNAGISIAAKWRDDMDNDKLSAADRAQARLNYEKRIATAGFPARPDGKPMRYRAAVKLGVVFSSAKNKRRGAELAAFLMQEERLKPYVEAALGRWYPVLKSDAAGKFWTDDPHRKAVRDQFSAGTLAFESARNWKFALLNDENVWARAMSRIVVDKWPVEKAVDELIARIREIAG